MATLATNYPKPVTSVLGLDRIGNREMVFVSHGHFDHIGKFRQVILTKPTYDFYSLRIGKTEATILDYYEPFDFNGFRLTLFPAGHILGSSQVILESIDERIVYTGDIKMRRGFTAEPLELLPCDILIIDATYGSPRYVFPPQDEILTRIKQEIQKARAKELIPVIFGYPLGKAQEALFILQKLGFTVMIDERIAQYLEIYTKNGIRFTEVKNLDEDFYPETDVLLISNRRYLSQGFVLRISYFGFRGFYTIFLSGWGMNPNANKIFNVDSVIPLSDHCDYQELIQYIKMAKPKKVYLITSFSSFCADLRKLGFDAKLLNE